MSYCLNPECSAPGEQKTLNPLQARFCSNCGAKLLLSDRYRALKLIGQGGFGKTFLAVDEQKPSRPQCVIKQFFWQQSDDAGAKAAELFYQEAVRLDELGQHPQIPALFAYCEQDHQKYLVQEFIDGQNLEQELRATGPFSEMKIRQLLTDLLPVLNYIHGHQVIHRDIKPENIIRRYRDGRCVLVDFGASKVGANPLQPGTKIGSRGYTPPEQSQGHASFVSDLYSLGATCIYLLTNLPLMDLFNEEEQRWYWKPHLKQSLSISLERVLDQLVQRDLTNRYQSAADVLQDLEAIAPNYQEKRLPQWDIESAKTVTHPVSQLLVAPAIQSPRSGWTCLHTIQGHESWIRSIAFTADGQTLVSGSGDKTVKVWSVNTGELLHTLNHHTSWVQAIAINPNGRTLATAENDKVVRIWDLQTGQLQHCLNRHTDWVRAIAFTADGKTLISGSQDKTAILWDWATATPHHILADHTHWVVTVASSANDQTIVTGSRDQSIRIWRADTGKCRYSITGHTAETLAVAISPDSRMLVSSSADQTAMLWKLSNGKHLHTFLGHEGAVNTVAISPDGKTIATGSHDQTIKLWRMDKGHLITTLTEHRGWVWAVAFSPDGQTLASSSWDGEIKIWQRDG